VATENLLVHSKAPFLMRDKITIAADCAALLNEKVGQRFRNGDSVIIGCPPLEDPNRIMDKIALIMKETKARSVEVYTMEVPCCHAIHMMVSKMIKNWKGYKVQALYHASIIREVRALQAWNNR